MRKTTVSKTAASHFRFSLVEATGQNNILLRFFVTKAPNETNIDLYLAELKKHNVAHIVRVCQPTYEKDNLEANGVTVHDLYFPDGKAPSSHVMNEWRSILEKVFHSKNNNPEGEPPAIAVHCVAGLGRAPVMVALALIEEGMDNAEAIKQIRNQITGSFNQNQIRFLMAYHPTKKGCLIM